MTGDTTLDLQLGRGGACFVQVGGLPADALGGAVRVFGPDLAAVVNDGLVPLRDDATAQILVRDDCLVQARVPGQHIEPATRLLGPATGRIDFFASPAAAPAGEGAMLRGTVRSPTGQALGGVHVVLRDRSHCDLATVVADRGGAFAVRLVLPPDGFVRAGVALGEGLLVHDEASVVDGFCWAPHTSGSSAPVELFLEATRRWHGVVQAPKGNPLAYAEVVVVDPDQPHRALVELRSDLAGRIDVGLPRGTLEVLATAPSGEVCRGELRETPSGGVEAKWQQIETGVVEGTVLDSKGRPLGTVEVRLGVLGAAEAYAGERQSILVRTDRNGRFRCRGVPKGAWTVGIEHRGASIDAEVDVVANRTQTLQLAVGSR
ncbi:MAG: carboxypeptidase regulatory-like domain-containing protein [Planctomycetes bacterium]|nr:carboxypeptidase regulatory-like domain-containing protein [Planctomycetota bacterium]